MSMQECTTANGSGISPGGVTVLGDRERHFLYKRRGNRKLAIQLPAPPEPFGRYAEAVQAGNLLFLSGMLPTDGRTAKFTGRVGEQIDVATGQQAARLAAINAVAVARQHLGSLDRVRRIVRLGVMVARRGRARWAKGGGRSVGFPAGDESGLSNS